MFNCTPGLVISPLYRRVSTSGPLCCGYSIWDMDNRGHGVWQKNLGKTLDQQNRALESATVGKTCVGEGVRGLSPEPTQGQRLMASCLRGGHS